MVVAVMIAVFLMFAVFVLVVVEFMLLVVLVLVCFLRGWKEKLDFCLLQLAKVTSKLQADECLLCGSRWSWIPSCGISCDRVCLPCASCRLRGVPCASQPRRSLISCDRPLPRRDLSIDGISKSQASQLRSAKAAFRTHRNARPYGGFPSP